MSSHFIYTAMCAIFNMMLPVLTSLKKMLQPENVFHTAHISICKYTFGVFLTAFYGTQFYKAPVREILFTYESQDHSYEL